jgi:dynein heavy chain
LSNEDLLDILSQSKDIHKIQPHLNKCFGNVNGLEVAERLMEITHLISFEGERLELPKPIRVRGAAEQWLGALENGMCDAIKKHLKVGINEYSVKNYKEWIHKQAGQVVLLVSQINFNKSIVSCLISENSNEALKTYHTSMVSLINVVANLISKESVMHKLLTIEALITIEVHSRDILTGLIHNKISNVEDFEWRKNLRYEWEEHGMNCAVMQSDATFNYGYEYLGCSPRLVITPLTDRFFVKLIKLN